LSISAAVHAMVLGLVDGLEPGNPSAIRKVLLVEADFQKARKMHRAVRALEQRNQEVSPHIRVRPTVRQGRGGRLGDYALALVLGTAACSVGEPPRSRRRKALDSLLGEIPRRRREAMCEALSALRREGTTSHTTADDIADLARLARERPDTTQDDMPATRL